MTLCSDERTLYISNLDKNVTDDVLYELFLQAGPVERVSIVASNTNSTNYGFVTYKHEVTVDYAIDLYKDTYLFNKELSIKRRGKTNNGNGQPNNHGQYGFSESMETYNNKKIFALRQPLQSEMHRAAQNFKLNDNSPMLFNFKGNNNDGSWNRNKPYEQTSRRYSPRSNEDRRRYKGRDPQNKPYHSRNRWH